MFVWEGLPKTIPTDYLERTLIRHGYVMFYDNDMLGHDILRAEVIGWNRHDMPTQARSSVNTSTEINIPIERNIKRLTDSENAELEFDNGSDAVLISNMYRGENCREIVDHFAERLALAQQAFDTNLTWQNRPFIFPVDSNETKLTLERLFDDIETGKPFIIVDKSIMYKEGELGIKVDVPYIGKELMDTRNEIMMKFKETVGIMTAGVEKAERTNTLEITSNSQHTKTVLQIMLEQRKIAAENINAFYGLNVSCSVIGQELTNEEEGEEYNGVSDSGIEELTED